MNKEELNFINKLNQKELTVFYQMLNKDQKEILSYVQNRVEKSQEQKDFYSLIQDIPISYLPVIGINLPYLVRYDDQLFFNTIYDYYSMSLAEKLSIGQLGQSKMMILDDAVKLVLKYLEERIQLLKENGDIIVSGRELLDQELIEKKNLILEQASDIYYYFAENGSEYIFAGSKKGKYIESLVCKDYYKIRKNLVEILARYSHREDLTSHNIKSFQKFIRN